jgi:thimet oligopeptidase
MQTRIALWSLALAATSGFAATPPSHPGPAFPNFATPAALKSDCDKSLRTATAAVRRLERQGAGQRWLERYDDLNSLTEDLAGPIYALTNVHPDKTMRDASEACELRWQDFFSSLGQNEKLYRAARAVKPRDAIEREFLKTTLEGFEDSGVGLPAEQRARAKAIQDRISALNQTFDKNVRDANVRVAFSAAELKGVPESLLKDAARDDQGRVLLPTDEATYVAFMQTAEEGSSRERYWRAEINKGGSANLALLAEIAQLRRELAQLFGSASYADFTLRRRMARDAASANRFLDEVSAAVAERERREVEELRVLKAKMLGLPIELVRLERWDTLFYTERARRERYAVDQEAFRKHLPPQESLALAMRMIEKMFGVRYSRVPGVALWHPDAQAYAVSDAATGRALATLYVDLFPREGKGDGAWVSSYRNVSTRSRRLPAAVLVTNLDRRGLTLDDFGETLLHEFGHSVHNNLSRTRFSSQGGTSVLRDFVEAPSQMLEAWAWDRDVLAQMREVCGTCAPVPDALLAQAVSAKRFGKGVRYGRQALLARFDLGLHDASAPEPMALWSRLEGATPLGHVAGSMLPAGFTHVAGGYAAGYYGYLWSEVVAADLRTAFEADKLNAAVGARYRNSVLAQGGQRPPRELVQEFLGRDFNANAFFEELKK